MSAEQEQPAWGGFDFELVTDVATEPSWITEIARVLQEAGAPFGMRNDDGDLVKTESGGQNPTGELWSDLATKTAVVYVSDIVNLLQERDGPITEDVEKSYDTSESPGSVRGESQSKASTHLSATQPDYDEGEDSWLPYRVVEAEKDVLSSLSTLRDNGYGDAAETIENEVDNSVTVDEKLAIVEKLSRLGNDVSKDVELIAGDTLRRQFIDYDSFSQTGYNSPKPDIMIRDDDRRQFGLSVEVTNRWVNPVGEPYFDRKRQAAMERDMDLLVVGPRFTGELKAEYPVGEEAKDSDKLAAIAIVPDPQGGVFYPTAVGRDDIPDEERLGGGTPVVVPDPAEVQQRLRGAQSEGRFGEGSPVSRAGRVGSRYPVAPEENRQLADLALEHNRDVRVIPESRYRNAIREAIEPFLDEFARPYRIEQFLLDTYWDEGLTQLEIADRVGVSRSTIRDWMSSERWDIVTRGFAGQRQSGKDRLLTDETREIWKLMYLGEGPFEPAGKFTGYEIQAHYNRHPLFDLDDWREWFQQTAEERAKTMNVQDPARENIDYTVMLGEEDRLMPSYQFIIDTLRDMGIEIREGMFAEIGSIPVTKRATEFMLNRNLDGKLPGSQLAEDSVVVMRSNLEVTFAEWLSENKVPFAYEPFTIPGLYGPGRDEWEEELQDIRSFGRSRARNIWEKMVLKHDLKADFMPDTKQFLKDFDRQSIVPDFVLYPGERNVARGPEWDGWSEWDTIVEIAGAWAMEPFGDWRDWYRVTGVAEKEMMYKLLRLWDDVYFVIQDNGDITEAIRNDPHYIIVSSTAMESGLDKAEAGLL